MGKSTAALGFYDLLHLLTVDLVYLVGHHTSSTWALQIVQTLHLSPTPSIVKASKYLQ